MAAPPRPDGGGVEGTIVFTDLVGFTEFTSARGDAEALVLLATQDRLVRAELPDSARVVKEIGDGLFLWFPGPLTALQCSLALHRRFEEESSTTGLPLWIRVGMHHGRALPRGDDLVGNDVNIASRIVDVAAPGEVLVSDSVRSGVDSNADPDLRFEELGPVVMKGIPSPIRLWRVTDQNGPNR
jgi:adenylate cyclase